MAFPQAASRLLGQSDTRYPIETLNSRECKVPLGLAAVAVQSSIYDVPGGYRAVMFDRFSGVKDQVRSSEVHAMKLCSHRIQASTEGTHFLVPWLQRAILYDCRIKPRVREQPIHFVPDADLWFRISQRQQDPRIYRWSH